LLTGEEAGAGVGIDVGVRLGVGLGLVTVPKVEDAAADDAGLADEMGEGDMLEMGAEELQLP
jgi:hypothetical protein